MTNQNYGVTYGNSNFKRIYNSIMLHQVLEDIMKNYFQNSATPTHAFPSANLFKEREIATYHGITIYETDKIQEPLGNLTNKELALIRLDTDDQRIHQIILKEASLREDKHPKSTRYKKYLGHSTKRCKDICELSGCRCRCHARDAKEREKERLDLLH